jgi:adenylate cyclase
MLPRVTAISRPDDDDDRLLADNALLGERMVAVMRVLTWVLLGVASAGVGGMTGEARETSVVRSVVVFGWLVFAVAVVVLLRRARFTPARARSWPIAFMAVDFAVVTFLNLVTARGVHPEVPGAIFAIFVAFSVARFSSMHVWIAAAMASGCTLLMSVLLAGYNWRGVAMMLASYVALAAVVRWANRRVRRMLSDVRHRDRLARLLPAPVVEDAGDDGGAALLPAKSEVTILFSDIRDFTTLSQNADPGELLAILDDYFARMSRVVKDHGGMVNKFLGDGMLAVWGAPDVVDDHARRAVEATLAMRLALDALNEERQRRGQAPLRIGVGLHTGVVAAGMLGGSDQHEYTVIGDAVNVASRIEGLTKKLGAFALASEATWSRCGGAFAGERVGAEAVKGRDEPVVVYRFA